MRALVVDDSAAMRSVLKMVLTQAGFEVAEAKNGKEAIFALENGAGDVALVDWNMPEMGGLDFVRAVRADDRYGAMKIMMVTTETDLGQVREALDCGADEYVMKPFTRESILAKLSLLGF
jgi:two-component system chemotaxis response regulator CheY